MYEKVYRRILHFTILLKEFVFAPRHMLQMDVYTMCTGLVHCPLSRMSHAILSRKSQESHCPLSSKYPASISAKWGTFDRVQK